MDIIMIMITACVVAVVMIALIRTLWDMQDLRDEMAALRADNTGLFMVLKHHLEGKDIDIMRLTQDGTPIRETDIEE